MRKPYNVLPVEPDIIFCGGNANTRKINSAPVATIPMVEENIEEYLTAIMKINENIVNELASIMPGEPAVHLNAFIHTSIQPKSMISPGKESDCCNPKREKFQVKRSRLRLKKDRFVKFMTENAIISAANIWYASCVLAGRLKISSSVEPTISTNMARIMGIVKLSSLKNTKIATRIGIVTANPPNAGVIPW